MAELPNFLCIMSVAVALVAVVCYVGPTSGFVDNIIFAHNGLQECDIYSN